MTIDNTADIIDSRDIIERIAELEDQAADGDCLLDADERIELESLRQLAEQGSDYADDWEYGVTLVRDSYFTEYTRELIDDCGYFDGGGETPRKRQPNGSIGPDWSAWPYRCIDWEQAARELRMDYTAVDFDGVTYWVR